MDSYQITGVWRSADRKETLTDEDVKNSRQSGMEPFSHPKWSGEYSVPLSVPQSGFHPARLRHLFSLYQIPSYPRRFGPALMYLWLPLQCLRLLHTYVGHKSAVEKDSWQEEGEMEKSVGGRMSA